MEGTGSALAQTVSLKRAACSAIECADLPSAAGISAHACTADDINGDAAGSKLCERWVRQMSGVSDTHPLTVGPDGVRARAQILRASCAAEGPHTV